MNYQYNKFQKAGNRFQRRGKMNSYTICNNFDLQQIKLCRTIYMAGGVLMLIIDNTKSGEIR